MKCTLLVTKTFRKPSETSRGGYAKVVYLEPCQTSMVEKLHSRAKHLQEGKFGFFLFLFMI